MKIVFGKLIVLQIQNEGSPLIGSIQQLNPLYHMISTFAQPGSHSRSVGYFMEVYDGYLMCKKLQELLVHPRCLIFRPSNFGLISVLEVFCSTAAYPIGFIDHGVRQQRWVALLWDSIPIVGSFRSEGGPLLTTFYGS